MPNLVDKIKLNEKQDRRVKLLTEDKEKIRELYATGKYSLNNLAKQYNVAKKLIHITVNPEALKKSKEYTVKDEQADRTFVFPARLEQAMISNYGNYEVYLLFESGAYSYRAQKSVDIVDRVIVWG